MLDEIWRPVFLISTFGWCTVQDIAGRFEDRSLAVAAQFALL
jgi:hypothetical protein